MKQLITRAKNLFLGILVLSVVLSYFGVYRPMQQALEDNLKDNFELIAKSKADQFQEVINKATQGTFSLSSRSMIRNEIEKFYRGEVTLDALMDFTDEKYKDGVNVLDDVVFARRFVGDTLISEVIVESDVSCTQDVEMSDELSEKPSYHFQREEDHCYLDVISPIISSDVMLGHDVVRFTLDNVLYQLNETPYRVYIEKAENINAGTPIDQVTIESNNIQYVRKLTPSCVIVINAPKSSIFSNVKEVSKRTLIFVMIETLGIYLLANFIIMRYAGRVITHLSNDRDLYKSHADYDALTGAYTRTYLKGIIKKHATEAFTLALIDVDEFKCINDDYGHHVGDDVLKYIVEMLKKWFGEDSFIIRYGGDEFLIMIRDISIEDMNDSLKALKIRINSENFFNFNISFSYGVVGVDALSDLHEALDAADKKMYHHKNNQREI